LKNTKVFNQLNAEYEKLKEDYEELEAECNSLKAENEVLTKELNEKESESSESDKNFIPEEKVEDVGVSETPREITVHYT